MIQTLLKTQTAMVQIILTTGTAMEDPDGSKWTNITEDTNSLVPILPKTGTAMDGREWTDITEDRNRHGRKRMDRHY